MRLKVSENRQGSSGRSTVVKYLADVEFSGGCGIIDVRIESTIPEDADPILLREVTEAIRRGVQRVVHPRRKNATIVLHELVIHDVDCDPARVEKVTTDTFSALLSKQS